MKRILFGSGLIAAIALCLSPVSSTQAAPPRGDGHGSGAGPVTHCSQAPTELVVAGKAVPIFKIVGNTDQEVFDVVGLPASVQAVATQYGIKECANVRRVNAPFVWKLEGPAGSKAVLDNPSATTASFVPDVPGDYRAHLVACPAGCQVMLRDYTPAGKVTFERTTIPAKELAITVHVVAGGQLPPVFAPGNTNAKGAPFKGTEHQHFATARDACSSTIGIGLGAPEWFAIPTWTSPTPPYTLAEGRVYRSHISAQDLAPTHVANDYNANLEVDPPFRNLLVDVDAEDIGPFLPFGGMEIEWEFLEFPDAFRPIEGDRLSVLGFHVIDCGHEIHSEIHPPIATAVHRPRAVKLPAQFPYAQRNGQPVGPAQPIGSNVYVPGIVTDIWVSLNGGEILESSRGLHQTRTEHCGGGRVSGECYVPVGAPTTAGTHFRFNVYLPPSPTFLLRQVMTPRFDPALYVEIQDHPDAGALGASTNLPVKEVARSLDGEFPFVTYDIDLSSLGPGGKFAKRIVSAWVYPDVAGKNFSLQAYRVALQQMKVTETGDFSNGDWKLWASLPGIDAPWTKLIDCHSCIDSRTYTPTSSIFQAGAMDRRGFLRGDVLLFQPKGANLPSQVGLLRFTGYDEDSEGSDGVGGLAIDIGKLGSINDATVCDPNNLSDKSCPGFALIGNVSAGTTNITEALDPSAKTAFDQLAIHPDAVAAIKRVAENPLYAPGLSAQRKRVILARKDDEAEDIKKQLDPATLKASMQHATADEQEAFAKALRKRVAYALGPKPTAAHRRKVAKEIQGLKTSLPAPLYKKYFCDLETGRACP